MSVQADGLRIIADDVTSVQVVTLLQTHQAQMAAGSPPESVHTLDLDELRASDVAFFSAWIGDDLVGCGGIKTLDPTHAEIKSMHTTVAARGRGIGEQLLAHLISHARDAGLQRLSLETGSAEQFAPARRLYSRSGFSECEPFAPYIEDPHSVFMTLALGADAWN